MLIAVNLIFVLPGRAQNKGSESIQKKSNDNDANSKSLPPPVIQPDASQKHHDPSPNVAEQDIEHRVRIGPPVSVNSIKDRWDKALVFFTGLIVIVGGFQIIFLWWTLRATSDNAKAAKDAAKAAESQARSSESAAKAAEMNASAAEANTRTLRNIERPWILVRMKPYDPIIKNIEELRGSEEFVLEYTIKNYGRSPAWVTYQWATAKTFNNPSDLPAVPA